MSFTLTVVFVYFSHAILNNLPASHGNAIQGYRQETLNQVLTPAERENYLMYGTLPSRITYSNNQNAYVVTSSNNQNVPAGYKVMPRWEYYLTKLVPDISSTSNLMQKGLGSLSSLSSLFGGGNGDKNSNKPNDDEKDDKNKDENNDDKNKDENKDNKKDDGKGNYAMVKDVLTSDITKDVTKAIIRAGISFLPGGGAALSAMDTGSKVAGIGSKIAKIH